MPSEAELIGERVKKTAELRRIGVNPYPYSYKPTHHSSEILQKYSSLENGAESGKSASIAGRIIALRRMGKATFMHILDETGKLQLMLREDTLGEEKYGMLKLLDIGDWIGAEGSIIKTNSGEITIRVSIYTLLCKSIRPLPEKWHGLQDVETRYRERYLDLIANPDVRKVLKQRSNMIKAIRDFMHEREFMEVETPILQTIYGGANARPFTTHMHDIDLKMYLRISPELYLKRLIVGGFEKVFELGRVFRNESMDKDHNPEFTSIEWYQAYADYNTMMSMTEDLFLQVCAKVIGSTQVRYVGHDIEFKKSWARITMLDAIKIFAGIDIQGLSDESLKHVCTENGVELPSNATRGMMIAEVFGQVAQPKIIQPTFVTDHPIETTPLCKQLRTGSKDFVERFELFICGMELANAYSELNDPILQRELLEKQASALRLGNAEANPMDEDFVRAIEQGMPPTGGIGIGIDRMALVLTGQANIRDVLLFPTMKPSV